MNIKDIIVIRSERRRRTIQSKLKGDVFYVYLPSGLKPEEERRWVEHMKKRYEQREKRRRLKSDKDLEERAEGLNKRFFDGSLKFSIKYVTNQNTRFGSCTYKTKSIRISDRIVKMPRWVQDYIIIHELTHLIYPDHSKKFWSKVNEYKLSERARGYLIAVGMSDDE
ncbi:MAG: M48 family metallopeptidase [Candidatus Thermoplasmatota archaeon]